MLSEAGSKSASSRTTAGFFPPISNCTLVIFRQAMLFILIPTSVEPVKDTALTAGLATISFPISEPEPVTKFRTPFGRPASINISTNLKPERGVKEAGLKTTVFPAIKAGTIFRQGTFTGKFHGVRIETTPSGCLIV